MQESVRRHSEIKVSVDKILGLLPGRESQAGSGVLWAVAISERENR